MNAVHQAIKLITDSWVAAIDNDRGNLGGSNGQGIEVLLVLFVFLVKTTVRTGLRWPTRIAHLGEFHDVQRRLHDILDDGTRGWRKGTEDGRGNEFRSPRHRCGGLIARLRRRTVTVEVQS